MYVHQTDIEKPSEPQQAEQVRQAVERRLSIGHIDEPVKVFWVAEFLWVGTKYGSDIVEVNRLLREVLLPARPTGPFVGGVRPAITLDEEPTYDELRHGCEFALSHARKNGLHGIAKVLGGILRRGSR